jgi:hypothetical protein
MGSPRGFRFLVGLLRRLTRMKLGSEFIPRFGLNPKLGIWVCRGGSAMRGILQGLQWGRVNGYECDQEKSSLPEAARSN